MRVKKTVAIVGLVLVVAALTLLAWWGSDGGMEPAQAQGPVIVALDMDPPATPAPVTA